MRIAITGGTGFVGSHLARALRAADHEVVLITRGRERRDAEPPPETGVHLAAIGLDDPARLAEALAGCAAVAHCAGINRELGRQTYRRVHVQGTRNLLTAAQQVGVPKVVLMSFLRARPGCGSPYHESKWAAEQLVRGSGLDYTIIKAGMVYGRGDHMLSHLSRALYTLPVFAAVGLADRPLRPLAVEDLVRVVQAALVDGRLSGQTLALTGPEKLRLLEAVRRVAAVVGRRPLLLRLPVACHEVLAWVAERTMKVPLVSQAQVRILAEGVVEPTPPCDSVPADLAPTRRFTPDQIRAGLPAPRPFGLADLRCCAR